MTAVKAWVVSLQYRLFKLGKLCGIKEFKADVLSNGAMHNALSMQVCTTNAPMSSVYPIYLISVSLKTWTCHVNTK